MNLNDINEFQLTAILESVAPVFTGSAGKRMKLLRMKAKLDQSQLGELLGVGAKTICGAENGARSQRNPISMSKLISVFGVRGVVYILSGKYSQGFEEQSRKIHSEYWNSKHAPQGYRVKHSERPHLAIGRSKHDLVIENKNLMEEIHRLKGKKSNSGGKD